MHTGRRIILQQPEKLDLDPWAWNAVVKVIRSNIIVHDNLLQPLCSLDVAPPVFLWLILSQCQDQRGNGQSHTHIRVVHYRDDTFGPFVLHNAGVFAVKSEKRQGGLLFDECFRGAVSISNQAQTAENGGNARGNQ